MDKMTYVIDIDQTICRTNESDYENSEPMQHRIDAVNKLYDDGHTVLFLTARGMCRNKNDQQASITELYDFTFNQLTGWGVKFHQLFLGKPAGDIYIDDKGCKDIDFFDE
tara:strand:- start:2291 stop:2620 length:330 start_codon:yes stop_codon:yes gene_type:complete